jgi:putative SOS response-associated peptidase YedK
MPAILRDEDRATWLDLKATDDALQSLIATREWCNVTAVPIAKLVPDIDSTNDS